MAPIVFILLAGPAGELLPNDLTRLQTTLFRMKLDRFAPVIGLMACLAVLITIIVPYVVVPPQGVSAYYDVTIVGPLVVGLIAVLTAIAFIAGLTGRFSPAMIAGATLIFGLVMVVLAAYWAVAVPPSLVMELSRVEELIYHRWVLVLFTLIVPISGIWYAKNTVRESMLA